MTRCVAVGLPMDRLSNLIIRLQRLGYRTQTNRKEIVLEIGPHSRMRGSIEDIEKVLPSLGIRQIKATGVRVSRRVKKNRKRKKARSVAKPKLTSANIPAVSIETRRGPTIWRASRSQGGLPGLGKHH